MDLATYVGLFKHLDKKDVALGDGGVQWKTKVADGQWRCSIVVSEETRNQANFSQIKKTSLEVVYLKCKLFIPPNHFTFSSLLFFNDQ